MYLAFLCLESGESVAQAKCPCMVEREEFEIREGVRWEVLSLEWATQAWTFEEVSGTTLVIVFLEC